MKDTFDWFHKDPAKIIESKTGLITKSGLIKDPTKIITGRKATEDIIRREFEI